MDSDFQQFLLQMARNCQIDMRILRVRNDMILLILLRRMHNIRPGPVDNDSLLQSHGQPKQLYAVQIPAGYQIDFITPQNILHSLHFLNQAGSAHDPSLVSCLLINFGNNLREEITAKKQNLHMLSPSPPSLPVPRRM